MTELELNMPQPDDPMLIQSESKANGDAVGTMFGKNRKIPPGAQSVKYFQDFACISNVFQCLSLIKRLLIFSTLSVY